MKNYTYHGCYLDQHKGAHYSPYLIPRLEF